MRESLQCCGAQRKWAFAGGAKTKYLGRESNV